MARTNRTTTSTKPADDTDAPEGNVDVVDSDVVTTNDPRVPTAHVPTPAEDKGEEAEGVSFTLDGGTKVTAEQHVADKLKGS